MHFNSLLLPAGCDNNVISACILLHLEQINPIICNVTDLHSSPIFWKSLRQSRVTRMALIDQLFSKGLRLL
jgi:hypothetical protein